MRTRDEVLEKLEGLRHRRLEKRKDEHLSQCPRNCVFNKPYRIKGKGEVRLCFNEDVLSEVKKPCFVCDDNVTAEQCKRFESNKTEQDVEDEFDEILASPARCGHSYPKLAILIWFLQDFDSSAIRQGEGSRWKRMLLLIQDLIMLKWW